MVSGVLKDLFKRYGPTMFVLGGLAVVGLTVTQVQSEKRLPTRAAGDMENQASDLGFWIEPQEVLVDDTGFGKFSLRLETFEQLVVHARLVLKYNPLEIKSISVETGSAFEDVSSSVGDGQLVLASNGEFFGSGTWVRLRAQLEENVNRSTLEVVPELSSLRYESGESRDIGQLSIVVKR